MLDKSKKEIIIIDNYAGRELWDILKDINKNIAIISKDINEELIKKIETKTEQIINEALKDKKINFILLKEIITENLYPYINYLTGRKPIILPIILDIKK